MVERRGRASLMFSEMLDYSKTKLDTCLKGTYVLVWLKLMSLAEYVHFYKNCRMSTGFKSIYWPKFCKKLIVLII